LIGYIYSGIKHVSPLSANVEYTPQGGDDTCSGCSALYWPDHWK